MRNKSIEVAGETVDITGLDHMTHHSLPHQMMAFNPPANLIQENQLATTSEVQLSQHPTTSQLNQLPNTSQLNQLPTEVTPILHHLPQSALHQSAVQPPSVPHGMQPPSVPHGMQPPSAPHAMQGQHPARERTSSNQSVEQMICEEQILVVQGGVTPPTLAWSLQVSLYIVGTWSHAFDKVIILTSIY